MVTTAPVSSRMNDVKKLIADIAEVSVKELKDDDKFSDDLGIDSMKALELVAGIEKKLKITIPENRIPSIRTPRDVYALVEKLKKK